ncbi:MAG: NYN domain-containing protein [Gemmatimonadota bacterium]|nr:NYN domain-containing protein [Gemmatimonadota bacterium]
MITPYTTAPHQGGSAFSGASATPHAALLIDFDNVTMGMRSDLSKEIKTLLGSDVIKGKVSVQRAYADWRRYPQYIVPLSEASVDLIFAPAYGSNKKNATDIRMAIDALELIFIRPEIGTYILLTGDSDFSSLVLKLKEYGKYVIGVGIQESSSDILVQNCDEYYSYTSLTGLTKTTDVPQGTSDPWVLVKDAVTKMVQRDDVMRSDRLKQVMQEIDSSFDEGALGFSKFSKFLSEASSRGLVKLRKLENGQYEIDAPKGKGGRNGGGDSDGGRSRRDRKPRGGSGRRERQDRDDDRATRGRGSDAGEDGSAGRQEQAAEAPASNEQAVSEAIDVLTGTLERLSRDGRESVRDSDVKRKILETHPDFDEAALGFSKFSKFLSEAVDRGAVVITRTENGSSEVALPDRAEARSDNGPAVTSGVGSEAGKPDRPTEEPDTSDGDGGDRKPSADSGAVGAAASHDVAHDVTAHDQDTGTDVAGDGGPKVVEVEPPKTDRGLKLGPRGGSTRRRSSTTEDTVPLFEGQTVPSPSAGKSEQDRSSRASPAPERQERPKQADVQRSEPESSDAPTGEGVDLKGLGLPTDPDAIVRYMTHRYKGVGEKTAETLVDRFGTDVFTVLRDEPDRIRDAVPARRGEQVLEAWTVDYERRTGQAASRGGSGGSHQD